MSRKLSLTPEVEAIIVAALQAGNARITASRLARVHRDTLDGWMQRAKSGEEPFATFAANVEHAEATHEARLVSEIDQARPGVTGVSGPDPWTNKAWILERRYASRWAARVRQQVTEELGNLLAKIEARLPPETFQAVIDATREDAPSEISGDARH